MMITNVACYYDDLFDEFLDLDIETDHIIIMPPLLPSSENNEYIDFLTRKFDTPINFWEYQRSISDDEYCLGHGLNDLLYSHMFHDKEKIQKTFWSYHGSPVNLVCNYLNKDFESIINVPDFLKNDWHVKILLQLMERHSPLCHKYNQILEEVINYNSEYNIRLMAVINDLKKIDFNSVKHFVDTIFFDPDSKDMSLEERFFAYTHSYKSPFRHYQYNAVINVTGSDKSETVEFDYETYNNLQILSNIPFEGFTEKQKYYELLNIIRNKKLTVGVHERRDFFTLSDCIIFFLHEMIRKNITINICDNCGKYFIPEKRSDTKYCTYAAPQDQQKTCQEYGKYVKYLTKTQTDEATKLYKQIYNKRANKARRCKTLQNPQGNPHLNSLLVNFINQSRDWKKKVREGSKSEAEYIEWLLTEKNA